MRLEFQKTISNSQFSLPVVTFLSLLVYFVLPLEGAPSFDGPEYGLFAYISKFVNVREFSMAANVLCMALSVYLLAELNNSNVLLRISSRMLSSMLAFLLAVAVCLHVFQPASIIMPLTLLSFFCLFATFQRPSPLLTLLAFVLLSLVSLFYPAGIYLSLIYIAFMIYLRAFSIRCLSAAVIGTLLPYWIFACVALAVGRLDVLVAHATQFLVYSWPDYSLLAPVHYALFGLVAVMFVIGSVDFMMNSFLDKTRVRVLYNVVMMHGVVSLMLLALQPQHYGVWLSMLIVDTAIMYGHFFALTYTRVSHIINLIISVLALAILFLSR